MSETPAQGPGERLRSTRESMEVSVREVADALNLPNRVIECLETDDYDRLPPTVFTRGYLRSYARLLELPAEELLALYPEVEPDTETVPVTEIPPSGLAVGQNRIILIGAGAAILLVLIAIWLFSGGDDGGDADQGGPTGAGVTVPDDVSEEADPENVPPDSEPEDVQLDDPESSSPAMAPTRAEVIEGTAAGTEELLERAEAAAPGEVETRAEEPAVVEPEPAVTRDEAPEPTAAVREPVAEPAATAVPSTSDSRERRITEIGDDRIEFQFSEDCWVEVRSPDGANLYSDLNRAGRGLTLVGRGPFRIRLGYAPGVQLSYNGEAVSVERFTRNNVANLVVGEAQ